MLRKKSLSTAPPSLLSLRWHRFPAPTQKELRNLFSKDPLKPITAIAVHCQEWIQCVESHQLPEDIRQSSCYRCLSPTADAARLFHWPRSVKGPTRCRRGPR